MASEYPYSAETFPGTPAVPPPAPAAAYELRPLTLGEVLDRTFTVYRSRFWLFAGLGSVAAGLETLLGALQLIPMHLGKSPMGFPTAPGTIPNISPAVAAGMAGGMVIGILVFSVLYMFAYVVAQAATVFAVSEVYLGKPVTIAESVRATIGKWYRQLGIVIWQSFSGMWIPMVGLIVGMVLLALGVTALKILGGVIIFLAIVAGIPCGVVLSLRNSLGIQATVIEGLTVRAAMRRSKVLTAGAKGRIFIVYLLFIALSYVASLLQMPLMMFVMFTVAKGGRAIGSEIIMLLVGFVGHAAVFPILMIGLSLVYFDQRVRKEALDLVMLLGGEVAAQPAVEWNPAAPPAEVWPPLNTAVAESEPAAQVAEAAPAVQIVEQTPEENAGHADDAPVA